MTVASVHTIETLELLFWLDEVNYTGWYALDIFPYRENGIRTASESIRWIQGLQCVLDRIGRDRFEAVVAKAVQWTYLPYCEKRGWAR
jgi:hypothetical protein